MKKNNQGLTFIETAIIHEQDCNYIEPDILAFFYSLPETRINLPSDFLREGLIKKIDKILKSKYGLLAGARVYSDFIKSANEEDKNFAQEILSKVPLTVSNLKQMLNQEDKKIDNLIKEIKDLIKNLNKEDKSLRDQALEKKVNEAFEILYEEEDFENRAKSIREKVREDFIGEVLPKINAQTSKIKISISIVIQENIDKWSRLLERCSFKNSIFKLEGDEGLYSKISSFLNHDDLKSFLNTIPPGTIPTLMSIEEDGEISPKRLKECIPEYDTELSVAGELPDLNFVQITEKFIKA